MPFMLPHSDVIVNLDCRKVCYPIFAKLITILLIIIIGPLSFWYFDFLIFKSSLTAIVHYYLFIVIVFS